MYISSQYTKESIARTFDMGSDLGWLFSLCLQEAEFAQFFFFSIGCFLLHPLNHSILHLFIHKHNSCVSTHGVQSVISTRGSKQA